MPEGRALLTSRARRARGSFVTTMLLAATIAAAGAARAQPPPADAGEGAVRLYATAKDAYEHGRYREAAELLKEAYRLKPEPVLLYDLGRAYEKLEDPDSAVAAYDEYLKGELSPADRAAVEQKVASLRAALNEKRNTAAREREGRDRASSPSPFPWIVGGVGLVGLAVGGVLGVLAETKHSAAESDASQTAAAQDNGDAKSLATAANVAFIGGGTVAVLGLVWGLLDLRASSRPVDHRSAKLRPILGARWIGVALEVSP